MFESKYIKVDWQHSARMSSMVAAARRKPTSETAGLRNSTSKAPMQKAEKSLESLQMYLALINKAKCYVSTLFYCLQEEADHILLSNNYHFGQQSKTKRWWVYQSKPTGVQQEVKTAEK